MPYYDMKCRLCGGYVGQQFFDEENIGDSDLRMIGPGLCGNHDFSDPVPPAPAVFLPDHGPVGASVVLLNRTINTDVSFNGTLVTDKSIDGSDLIVIVPLGATTGDLVLTIPNLGTGSLGTFTVEE